MWETGFNPWGGKIPWRREWQLQYSCLENFMDRGAWQATVHGIAKSQMSMHAHTHTHTHTHTHSSLQKSEGQLHNAPLEAPEKPEAIQTATPLLSLSSGRLLHQTLDFVVCSQPSSKNLILQSLPLCICFLLISVLQLLLSRFPVLKYLVKYPNVFSVFLTVP